MGNAEYMGVLSQTPSSEYSDQVIFRHTDLTNME